VTDEAGKSRKSCSDGLGRLTQVFEDPANRKLRGPIISTDALDNLLVRRRQKGKQTQVLSANCASTPSRIVASCAPSTTISLSRLTSATNPESGTDKPYTYGQTNGKTFLTKTSSCAESKPATATVYGHLLR